MATSTGIINSLQGKFYAQDENGNVRVLKVGDEITQGEKVYGDASNGAQSTLEILTTDLETLSLSGSNTLVFDASTNSDTLQNEEVAFTPNSGWMQAENTNPTQEGEVLADAENADLPEEAAAAGEESTTSSDTGVLNFDSRDGNSTNIAADLRSANFPDAEVDTTDDGDDLPNNAVPEVDYNVALSLSGLDVNEDETAATFTLNLSNPTTETSTLVIDANGTNYTFTIPAGSSTYSFDIPTQDSDVYVDPESLTATVVSLTGGGYDNVDLTEATSTINISDTIDTTTVKVTTADVNENEDNVTFNFETSNAPQTGTTATLTVDVGGTEYTVNLDADGKGSLDIPSKDVDVYNDEQTVTAEVKSINGGNFEATDVSGASASAKVVDVDDTTTVKVTTADVNENEDNVTFNFETSNAPQTGTTATLTVDVGGTEYTVNLDADGKGSLDIPSKDVDVYNDEQTVTAEVKSINGGNFEATDVSGASASAKVVDVDDTTTVKVTTADVNENEDNVTFNFETSNAPQTGTTATLTVDVGGTEYTVNLDADGKGSLDIPSKDVDVYNDEQTVTAEVKSINGGNFEATDVSGASASAKVVDVDDTVIIKVFASDSNGTPLKDSTTGEYLTLNETPEGGETHYVALAFNPDTTSFNDSTVLDTQVGTVDFTFTDEKIEISGPQRLTRPSGEDTLSAESNDYTPQTTVASIALGTAVQMSAVDDKLVEESETLEVSIGNYTAPTSGTTYEAVSVDGEVVTTITDNDNAPEADPVLTTSNLSTDDIPTGFPISENDIAFFKKFDLGGGLDGDITSSENNASDPADLGGSDADSYDTESTLTFDITSLPTYGTLYIEKTDGSYEAISAANVADASTQLSTADNVYWSATHEQVSSDGTDGSPITIGGDYGSGIESSWQNEDVQITVARDKNNSDSEIKYVQGDGIGVVGSTGGPNSQLGYDASIEKSETIIVDFKDPVAKADVAITHLIEGEGEVGIVEAFLDGKSVGTYTFSKVDGAADITLTDTAVGSGNSGANNSGTFTLDGTVFDQLRFSAQEYVNQKGDSDSSDYFIGSIGYEKVVDAEFNYKVIDQAGNESAEVPVKIEVATDTSVPNPVELHTVEQTTIPSDTINGTPQYDTITSTSKSLYTGHAYEGNGFNSWINNNNLQSSQAELKEVDGAYGVSNKNNNKKGNQDFSIENNESLIFNLDTSSTSLSFDLVAGGTGSYSGEYTLYKNEYDSDGNITGHIQVGSEVAFDSSENNYSNNFTVTSTEAFDSVVFDGGNTSNSNPYGFYVDITDVNGNGTESTTWDTSDGKLPDDYTNNGDGTATSNTPTSYTWNGGALPDGYTDNGDGTATKPAETQWDNKIIDADATGTTDDIDVLQLQSNQDIDFSSIGDVIKNIEEIDLSVDGENELSNITLNDVIEMTDSNNDIKISGTSDDTVGLSGNWSTDDVDQDGYKEYVNSDDDTVKVKIQSDITDVTIG